MTAPRKLEEAAGAPCVSEGDYLSGLSGSSGWVYQRE